MKKEAAHLMATRITIFLPDRSKRTLPAGSTAMDLATSIGPRLAREAVFAVVDGREVDLSSLLHDGAAVLIVTADTDEGRKVIRHSTAHVLAQAVLDLWPGARFAIGPAIEDGFYYDFELPGGAHFSEDDLERIDKRMREIVAEGQPFVRGEHDVAEGLEIFGDQPYKREIIGAAASKSGDGEAAAEGAGADVISTYRNGPTFVDLCRGPHVPSTDRLGSFKLTRVAGAYWRGDEHNPQLQRIYGTAWESDKALDAYLHRLEEAAERDHRKLGAELDLFHFPPEVGGGLAVFHPKGALVRHLMEDYSRTVHLASGYELVWTPHLAKAGLFETSGHLQWYADGMYPPMELEGTKYYPKPMNCPMHILVYKSRSRSYRELPMRLFELGTVYRFERSGVLHGLTRVRGLTQDDAHIFCTPEQLSGELASLLAFVLRVLRTFGLGDFDAELSTRPDEFVGEIPEWDRATAALRKALEESELPFVVAEGEGAFYAPKIDVHMKDAIGRRWQMSTLQVDLQLPRLFELSYAGTDNDKHRPFMIHRVLFGSVERFLAILIEHYAGALPTWLAPVQVRIVPVGDAHDAHAYAVAERLRTEGFRVEAGTADGPLNARIRRSKLEKIPYILVVGDEDVGSGTVGVNARGSQTPQRGIPLEEFIIRLRDEVVSRAVSQDE